MHVIGRRGFLCATGLALGAALLALRASLARRPIHCLRRANPSQTGKSVRDAVSSSHAISSISQHFFSPPIPTPVREAIERHRAGFDADPIGYWFAHEKKQEATVLQAAADYLAVDPTDIALTDSTTMGLGLLYGGLQPRTETSEILTTTHDHYSTETSLRLRAERTGATLRRIPLYDASAQTSPERVWSIPSSRHVRPRTQIVAVTWVHSSTGLKLPIAEMARAIQRSMRREPKRTGSSCAWMEFMPWGWRISV